MEFIKETQIVNFGCAYYLWYNVIEDLINDDEEIVELSIENTYDTLLHIGYLIDTFHKKTLQDGISWEQYVEANFKNKYDTSTITVWHEPISKLITDSTVSFEYLFDEMLYVCAKVFENKDGSIGIDSIKGFFEHIVVNWELFEQSIFWIRSIKNNEHEMKMLCQTLSVDPLS